MDEPVNPPSGGSLNQITIWEPRWHDRTVLIADRKLLAHNEVIIEHKDFPRPFYLSGTFAKSFPLEQMSTKKSGGKIAVRAIPLSELEREIIDV
jgi:hypothetical protein